MRGVTTAAPPLSPFILTKNDMKARNYLHRCNVILFVIKSILREVHNFSASTLLLLDICPVMREEVNYKDLLILRKIGSEFCKNCEKKSAIEMLQIQKKKTKQTPLLAAVGC